MNQDEKYMKAAIRQAKKAYALDEVPIGCVIVQNDKIIARGYNRRNTEGNTLAHAELTAIRKASKKTGDWRLEDCTMYVTLEPCCHQGKTPPCTDIILERGIGKVYVGSMDPNPKVAGKGVQILRDHGVEVQTGLLEEECLSLNEIFFHYITTKMPYVAMKYAMTLDGKIASFSGDSKWVTGEKAREQVHRMRGRYRGIMVGIGTVLADDPMLNCRVDGGVDPVRIICDSNLHIPLVSQIVNTASEIETIVACSQEALESERKQEKIRKLQDAGIQLIGTKGAHGVNLVELMKKLGEQNIDSILLEGGGTLNASALEDGIVNKVYAYIAGKLIGGMDARSPVEGMGIDRMADAITLKHMEIERLDDDFCIVGYVK